MLLLDHEESIQQFNLYSLLLEKDISLMNLFSESDDPRYVDPTLDWVQRVAPEEMNHFQGPRGFKNHFLKGILSKDSSMVFHITVKADFADKLPNYVADTYALPDFPGMLGVYIDTIPGDHSRLRGCLLSDLHGCGTPTMGHGCGCLWVWVGVSISTPTNPQTPMWLWHSELQSSSP